MRYDIWHRPVQHEYYEQAWRRRDHAAWEAKWSRLTAQARCAVLARVKVAPHANAAPPGVPVSQFPASVVDELVEAGFVERVKGATPKKSDRLAVIAEARDFVKRVKWLHDFQLLTAELEGEVDQYVRRCFNLYIMTGVFTEILKEGGLTGYIHQSTILIELVPTRLWPQWTARSLNSPLAEKLIEALGKAKAPVLLEEVPALVPESDPVEVRSAVENLINRLALFEDLRPGTWELMLGFLPAVQKGIQRAGETHVRPPLETFGTVSETLPSTGFVLNDMRSFLLDLAGSPARLKQDGKLFQKETGRFLPLLEPLPSWTSGLFWYNVEKRLERVHDWSRQQGLVKRSVRQGDPWLELTSAGQKWLSGDLASQCSGLFAFLGSGRDQDNFTQWGDTRFLGSGVVAYIPRNGQVTEPDWMMIKQLDPRLLRESIHQAFKALPLDQFVPLDNFLAHAVQGEHNPLNLGADMRKVFVSHQTRTILPLEEAREKTARQVLFTLVVDLLIPLGCLQAGLNEKDALCIARHPRLAAYFGETVETEALTGVSEQEARVLVQPDFSIVIIGLNPTPGVELAPFCERVSGVPGHGTMQMKITRETVIKAVASGLTGEEILARLERHASNALPPNVARELREWTEWVRTVEYTTLTVVRCEDRSPADRVVAALGRLAERLNDTLVAIPDAVLGTAELNKLQQQGLLARRGKSQTGTTAQKAKKPKKKKRR